MSLVTTRGRSHHGVEVVVRRRLRFLRVEHGDALHFFVPDTFFQQLRLNKQFVAHPSAMASAIVAMIAANRLLTPTFVSRKDSGGNPSPELSDVLSWPKERGKKWIQEECRMSS